MLFLTSSRRTLVKSSFIRYQVPLCPLAEVPGLFFNGGYSGHCVMGAPEGSRCVVEMILGRLLPEDNLFRRERFAEVEVKKERLMI
jgi:glycine/D-amino acid oxidase-like deaminating enzyme